MLELAARLEERGLRAESHHAYWDVLAINPRNRAAQAALRRLKGEVTVTGLVPPPVEQSQLDELDESEIIELVKPEPRPDPPPPRLRSEVIRIPNRTGVRDRSIARPPPPKRIEQEVIAEITGDLDAPDPRGRMRARVALGVLMLAVIGLLAMVWDTRRELSSLSTELRAQRPAAASGAPQTIALTFGPATSIEYEAPVAGVVTSRADPGQLLQPGDLVAEIMNAGDYRRLVRARAKHRWLRRRAGRSAALEAKADEARDEALQLLKRGRRSYVRAAQRGIARPLLDLRRVQTGELLMRLDDPATLSAELPAGAGLAAGAVCRFTGEAAKEDCKLVFERGATGERVRVLLSNEGGRFLPGQTVEVTIEPAVH